MTNLNQPNTDTAAAGPGGRFLASLPLRYRPDSRAIARLAPKVDLLLANGWVAGELLRRLTAGIDSAHSPAGALVRRLEGLPLPKGVQAAAKPPWCGECDERTRMRETPDDKVIRCRECHPQRVAAPPAAS